MAVMMLVVMLVVAELQNSAGHQHSRLLMVTLAGAVVVPGGASQDTASNQLSISPLLTLRTTTR